MTQELVDRCNELGLTYGFKDEYIIAQNEALGRRLPLGRTELGRIVTATEGAINGTTLQIPTTEYHTANETAALGAIAGVLKLLKTYL